MQTFTSFGNVTHEHRRSMPTATSSTTSSYNPGGPGDIVVVRLFYQWPVYRLAARLHLSNMTGGKRLLVATAAFRNEPYAN